MTSFHIVHMKIFGQWHSGNSYTDPGLPITRLPMKFRKLKKCFHLIWLKLSHTIHKNNYSVCFKFQAKKSHISDNIVMLLELQVFFAEILKSKWKTCGANTHTYFVPRQTSWKKKSKEIKIPPSPPNAPLKILYYLWILYSDKQTTVQRPRSQKHERGDCSSAQACWMHCTCTFFDTSLKKS